MTVEDAGEPREKTHSTKRRWWIAGLLSLFLPGLGQFYNTDYLWAKRLFTVFIALQIVLVVTGYLISISTFAGFAIPFVFVALSVLVSLLGVVLAVFRARKFVGAQLTKWHHPAVYIGCVVAAIAVPPIAGLDPMSRSETENYNIPTDAGLPNLQIGDRLVSIENAKRLFHPDRGQIWVFKSPKNSKTNFIKRIIGLPGDSVQYRQGRLYLNGKLLARELVRKVGVDTLPPARIFRETLPSGVSYLIREASDSGYLDNTLLFSVPTGHYFALGDNRDDSLDSRGISEIGYIPAANMRDFPTFFYWARKKSRIGGQLQPIPDF